VHNQFMLTFETGRAPYVQNCMYSEHCIYILFSLLVLCVFIIATDFLHVCVFLLNYWGLLL